MLQDAFGRYINYLRISVTDRCNLRCVYCLPEQGVQFAPRRELLNYEEITEVVRAGVALGITHVRLTGGEPLVRKGFVALVQHLASLKGLEDLSMTTNGMRLADYVPALARAGLNRVNISLDTLDPERFHTITRLGQIESVWAGIDAAIAAGLHPVKINVVVLRGVNDDEILAFGRLARERPLHVRFIELMPIGDYFRPERVVPAGEIVDRLETLGGLTPVNDIAGCGPARNYRWVGGQGSVGVIAALTRQFCEGCNRLRLTATGQLRPCLDDEQAVDLTPALRPRVQPNSLQQLIRSAVANKPAAHHMIGRDRGQVRQCMAGVGG